MHGATVPSAAWDLDKAALQSQMLVQGCWSESWMRGKIWCTIQSRSSSLLGEDEAQGTKAKAKARNVLSKGALACSLRPSSISRVSKSVLVVKLQKLSSFKHSIDPGFFSTASPFHFFRKQRYINNLISERLVFKMAAYEGQVVTADVTSGNMVFEPVLEDGVFRFDCSGNDRDAAYPSLSFTDNKDRETPIMIHKVPMYNPTFECVHGQQSIKIEFPAGTSFYGTGEVSGQLERTGKRIFTWNTDAWGYGSRTTSLYQSHPWVLAVLPNGEALGVLADTTRRCEVDLREESIIKFIAPAAYPVITFGPFASPTAVLISLSHAIGYFLKPFELFSSLDNLQDTQVNIVTMTFEKDQSAFDQVYENFDLSIRIEGTVFMPPKWSLGYHQCRWSYDSDARVLKVARTFREKGIPCDVIWMDIDYMDGFRCFTFDQERFPDPKSLVNDLHLNGFKAIWMLDPGIKHEEGYFVYDSGSESDIWIQKADGSPFVGKVWPGPCVFPDFTQEKTRLWWAKLVKDFTSNGVDGIWNDMNEPAIFKAVTKTMPESNIHRGDTELGGCQNHSYYHNVYGMLMARSTYEGMKMANENKRPFVLTRAGFIGSQRYAATWTGDNLANWEHLHMSISMVLQLGISGQPLSGPDIGGFAGNATPKLFGRWMGVGAMFPFCRGHSESGTIDHEPWSFGEEVCPHFNISFSAIIVSCGLLFLAMIALTVLLINVLPSNVPNFLSKLTSVLSHQCEEVCRLALLRRYRLIPHIYTLFYMAHTKGTPVAAPTFFSDPKDPSLRTLENSFLLGPLLIDASTMPDQGSYQLQHILPKGIWLRFDFDDSHPDLPALYLQGGSIIPAGPPLQHVGEANPTDDLLLIVALDEHGKAEGVLFEDDGDGYEFKQGGYLFTYYVAELQSSSVTVKVSKTEGSWKRPKRRLHVQLLFGSGAMLDAWGTDGEVLQISMPSEPEVSDLISRSEKQYKTRLENAKHIPDVEEVSGHKGVELSRTPVELKNGDWILKVVPWIGGRMISMMHLPSGSVYALETANLGCWKMNYDHESCSQFLISVDTATGTQWLHSRVEIDGYEEYSGVEYRSAGCSEEYTIIE
ncbi:hypothetical protein HHK36_028274 [Tetracentron sinense]|uniref:Alpha-glucosidase n=1 Tax=Tetracentron sinense TaxID=13715 RepID=A0A834YI63_TETSI|nr:hypothetical protein HHK36_028274 [Tetracentron sinense]